MKQYPTLLFTFILIFCVVIAGCRKNKPITDPSAQLTFSTDTLTFDTVFTSLGSATRHFKVFNPHNQEIIIDKIDLEGGKNSQFRLNVDGVPGIHFENIKIAPNDSIYVFVEVTVDPNADNPPFVIRDSMQFVTNGNNQYINLEAYGQNAHFIGGVEICNETWTNDRPYFITSTVLVDTNCVLTIEEGCQIYLQGPQTNFFVAGTLRILGTEDTSVTFQGDRLEQFFDDLPGQWGTLVFLRGSTNNVIEYAKIKESTTGITLGSMASSNLNDFVMSNIPDLRIHQSEISFAREYGIFSFFSAVEAENLLIHSCGKNDVALLFGGLYNFMHSTLVNYGVTGFDHKSPVVRMTNFAAESQTVIHTRPLDATFTNCIINGNISMDTSQTAGELAIEEYESPGQFDYLFDHCLIRSNLDMNNAQFVNPLQNQAPQFKDQGKNDYRLTENSPCIDAGTNTPVTMDLKGKMRDALPDIGAYEFQ